MNGSPTFCKDGAERHDSAVQCSELRCLEEVIAELPSGRAGLRLYGLGGLQPFLTTNGPFGSITASALGNDCHPVRAILFDKTAASNWALAWHQDRTIAVRERLEVEGFGPWTVKNGLSHVEPPFELLAGMVTLRVHLDPVPETNAPLLIAPDSHKSGRIPVGEIQGVVDRCGTVACLADAGDVWLYATPILHASKAAMNPSRRRVLQVDFAVGDLPDGLRWLGV